MTTITIEEAARFIGEEIILRGWVYNKRSSGKIIFLQIRDGTGVVQGVITQSDSPSLFVTADKLSRESSVVVEGTLQADSRAPGGCELKIEQIQIIQQPSEPFPIELKAQSPGFLMDHRHLWIRTGRQVPILRIRDSVFRAIRNFFHEQGFIATEAPILTGASVEGTTTLFDIDYFGTKAYLAQSGQLYLEATAMALGKVYWIGPVFRAERSKTRKHLTEFWMAEAETAFYDHNDNMRLQEELVAYIVETVIDERGQELDYLKRDTALLREQVSLPFPRVTYDEAITMLQDSGHKISSGDDFGAPQEAALGDRFRKPVFVEYFPASMKPFYMKLNPENPEVMNAVDLLIPNVGEIIGGSQREDDLETLLQRMSEEGLDPKPYYWYIDQRKYGTVPHSGFGLGLERQIQGLLNLDHIREACLYPRLINRATP